MLFSGRERVVCCHRTCCFSADAQGEGGGVNSRKASAGHVNFSRMRGLAFVLEGRNR
jgi:hypothetical protein